MLRQEKQWWVCASCLLALVLPAVPVHAAVPTVLAPVLDNQTFMVIHVHVTTQQIDALTDKILNMIQTTVGDAGVTAFKDDLNEMRSHINQQLQRLQQAGAREIYGVWSQDDFPVPFVVVPVAPGAQVKALMDQLKQMGPHFEAEALNPNLIVAGEPQTLVRLKQLTPQADAPIVAAFKTQGSAPLEVMVAPNADQRRIVAEMLPTFALTSGTIPTQALIDNLQWGVLRLNTPPQMSLQVFLESQDQAHSRALQTALQQTYTVFGQQKTIRTLMPGIDGVLTQLTPKQEGQHLALKVNQAAADTMMKNFIAPSLLGIRSEAARWSCGTNLSTLGKAMLIYANDYKDALPLKWDDFKLAEVPDSLMVCPAVKTKGSYIYRGAGLTTSASPDLVIIYDKKGNHPDGRNVLFLDSRVEWVTEKRFQALIRQDNTWRRTHDMPEIPPQ